MNDEQILEEEVTLGGSAVDGVRSRRESGGTVLLIEDNPADARLIEEMLRDVRKGGGPFEGDVELIHEDSFESGVEAYDEGTRVVLLDLNLPDASGIDTVARAIDTFEDSAIVVLTGLDDDRIGQEAVERGAQDFVNKDEINRRTLRRTIRYADERHCQERELKHRAEKLAVLTWVLRHEIRDAMTVALGRSQSLWDYVEAGGERYLSEVVDATEEVLELTDTVEEFLGMLDGGEMSLHEVDLRAVVLDEVETARLTHEEAVVEVEGEFPEVTVRGTELLGSVFSNLLNNAVRHNPRDEPRVSVRGRVDEGVAVVEVADNGAGIPDDRKDEVFELARHRDGSPGTGVGLFLVDTVVERCGGEVEIDDNEPHGTVVRVALREAEA